MDADDPIIGMGEPVSDPLSAGAAPTPRELMEAFHAGFNDPLSGGAAPTPPAPTPTDHLVWSHEHDAWWRPNRCGYTTDLAQAGLYTKAEAEEIARETFGGRREGRPDEEAVPVGREIAKLEAALANLVRGVPPAPTPTTKG